MLQTSIKSATLIGSWANKQESKIVSNSIAILGGVLLLTALAQIAIPLPFTPVPITGQTLGVMLVSLIWGRKLGFATVASYLALGSLGLPVFAAAPKLLTMGYLFGMAVASLVVGTLADKGWSKTFKGSFAACLLGSLCVFTFGLLVLGQFVPTEVLLAQGLLPFLPGDMVKSTIASLVASRLNRRA